MSFTAGARATSTPRFLLAIGHGGIFSNVLPQLCTIPPRDDGKPLGLHNTALVILRSEDVLTCELWNGLAHLA